MRAVRGHWEPRLPCQEWVRESGYQVEKFLAIVGLGFGPLVLTPPPPLHPAAALGGDWLVKSVAELFLIDCLKTIGRRGRGDSFHNSDILLSEFRRLFLLID